MDRKRTTGKEKNMMLGFKKFMNLQADKKCPPGYRFDTKLKVCVPIGVTRYYPYFGTKSDNGDQETDTTNGNGQNGNGTNGNGQSGNGNNNSGNGNGQ